MGKNNNSPSLLDILILALGILTMIFLAAAFGTIIGGLESETVKWAMFDLKQLAMFVVLFLGCGFSFLGLMTIKGVKEIKEEIKKLQNPAP
jgi:hypothetical protein